MLRALLLIVVLGLLPSTASAQYWGPWWWSGGMGEIEDPGDMEWQSLLNRSEADWIDQRHSGPPTITDGNVDHSIWNPISGADVVEPKDKPETIENPFASKPTKSSRKTSAVKSRRARLKTPPQKPTTTAKP